MLVRTMKRLTRFWGVFRWKEGTWIMFEKALRQNLGTDIIRAHTKQMFLPDIKVWLFFCLVFLFPLPEVNILNKIFVFNEEKKKKTLEKR